MRRVILLLTLSSLVLAATVAPRERTGAGPVGDSSQLRLPASAFLMSDPAHVRDVWSVAFSPNGKTLASGSSDRTIRIWDVASRKQLGQPLRGHTDRVGSVAFSPDGKRLA